MRLPRRALSFLPLILAAACGQGGSGSTPWNTTPDPTTHDPFFPIAAGTNHALGSDSPAISCNSCHGNTSSFMQFDCLSCHQHQNQAALNTMASALRTLKNAPLQLADQLAGPDASLRERARAMMALGSMSVGWMFLADQVTNRDELSEIVSDIAGEIVDPLPAYGS